MTHLLLVRQDCYTNICVLSPVVQMMRYFEPDKLPFSGQYAVDTDCLLVNVVFDAFEVEAHAYAQSLCVRFLQCPDEIEAVECFRFGKGRLRRRREEVLVFQRCKL